MSEEPSKLVRDNIPELIRNSGKDCKVLEMSDAEYKHALLSKLVEEAHEVAEANAEQLVAELADLFEVIDTILEVYKIQRSSVQIEQERRRSERGGFRKKLRLFLKL